MADQLRARAGRALERGRVPRTWTRIAESGWAAVAARRLRSSLDIPPGAAIIGIGGAVLGGAGKTPLAIAVTRELARRGARVALVGHAYRARPSMARIVGPSDPVDVVGDDALHAARELVGSGAPVVVAPSRQAAVDLAAAHAEVLVIDGMLQARPHEITAAVLTVVAGAPWGSGRCPPLGDLRAPVGALLAAADLVAGIDDGEGREHRPSHGLEQLLVASRTAAARVGRCAVPLRDLAAVRTGLIVGVARPDRIERALQREGIVPAVVVALGDHAHMREADLPAAARTPVDLWLTTGRCATKLPLRLGGAPVAALEHGLAVAALVDRLAARLGAAQSGDARRTGRG